MTDQFVALWIWSIIGRYRGYQIHGGRWSTASKLERYAIGEAARLYRRFDEAGAIECIRSAHQAWEMAATMSRWR